LRALQSDPVGPRFSGKVRVPVNTYAAAYHRLPRNSRGALWMLASAVTFTVMTMLIKFLGEDYPAALQTFYRQAAGLVVMLPMILHNPRRAFHTTRPGILLFRATAGTVGTILAFYAYQKLPLADANALSFTRALWLVPLAAFVLEEKVGMRRVSATAIGFFGALFMLQPAAQGNLGLPSAAALGSALLFAFTVTGMKVMTRDHTIMSLMAWSAALGFLLAIPPALFVWRWPTGADLALLAGMGVLGTITQACYIKGMSIGDAAVMAPIDYTRLVFAVALDYLLFEDVPNTMTMIGAGIVIASTIYITLREARLGRPVPPPSRGE
jgi:drug/metabolite transporter (DMT)-like permease